MASTWPIPGPSLNGRCPGSRDPQRLNSTRPLSPRSLIRAGGLLVDFGGRGEQRGRKIGGIALVLGARMILRPRGLGSRRWRLLDAPLSTTRMMCSTHPSGVIRCVLSVWRRGWHRTCRRQTCSGSYYSAWRRCARFRGGRRPGRRYRAASSAFALETTEARKCARETV